MRIGDSVPDGLELSAWAHGQLHSQCPPSLIPSTCVAFADVGQDWALLDTTTGTVVQVSHEGGPPTPSLDGPGDLLIRWLADLLEVG